jgi:protein-disulfide isomerase
MSEGSKGSGRKGGRPEAGQGGPFLGLGGGGSSSLVGWIVSANIVALVALVLAVVVLVLHLTEEDGDGGAPAVAQASPTAQPSPTVQATPTPVVVDVSVDDDPSWGPEDAPVTIIEFSEFLCPYCQRFALQTLPLIEDAYEGKVRYVYRDFIVHGETAMKISEAAECADDQGKFWEYHDNLWVNYNALGQQAGAGIDALTSTLKGYASDLGLDTAAFDDCLDTGKYTAEVGGDSQDAQLYGVSGTPSFFINGQLVVGAIPFEDYQGSTGAMQPGFKSIIDEALAEAEASSAVPTVPSSPSC